MLLLGPDQPGTFVHEGEEYPFTITLKRALDAELTLRGDERTNGLVILSGMAVLDCQLFDYENQVGNEYLFGTVRCPALIEQLGKGAAIISDNQFAVNAIQDLAGGFRGMVRHTKNLKLRNTRERIAAYLLRQSRLLGNAAGFTLPVEKRLIASYMGMTPENLSRTFKSLADDGCKISGHRVVITDRKRFEALAGLSPLLDGPDQEAQASGVSLPMLLRALTYREKGMETMLQKAISGAHDGITKLPPPA